MINSATWKRLNAPNGPLENCFPSTICAFFLLNICVFWAGMFSFDTDVQWRQVLGENPIDSFHPPLLVWWWRMLYRHLMAASGSIFVFQCVLFWCAMYLFGKEIGKKYPALSYTVILVWLTPGILSMTAMIIKDTSMTGSYMLACALMLRATINVTRMKPPAIILCLLLLFYGTAVRHNAISALPVLCVWFVIAACGARRLRAVLPASIIIFIALNAGIYYSNQALIEKKRDATQALSITHLIGMSHRVNQLLFPLEYLEELHMKPEDFLQNHPYYPNYTDIHDLYTENFDTSAALMRAYLHAIRDYPLTYLQFRTESFLALLSFNTEPTFAPFAWNEWDMNTLKKWSGDYLKAARDTFWFRPWIWFIACFLLFFNGLNIWKEKGRGGMEIIFLTMSGIMYEISYFFLTPSADFRYSYWMIASVFLAGMLTLPRHFSAHAKEMDNSSSPNL